MRITLALSSHFISISLSPCVVCFFFFCSGSFVLSFTLLPLSLMMPISMDDLINGKIRAEHIALTASHSPLTAEREYSFEFILYADLHMAWYGLACQDETHRAYCYVLWLLLLYCVLCVCVIVNLQYVVCARRRHRFKPFGTHQFRIRHYFTYRNDDRCELRTKVNFMFFCVFLFFYSFYYTLLLYNVRLCVCWFAVMQFVDSSIRCFDFVLSMTVTGDSIKPNHLSLQGDWGSHCMQHCKCQANTHLIA